jgi:hypothetical protein
MLFATKQNFNHEMNPRFFLFFFITSMINKSTQSVFFFFFIKMFFFSSSFLGSEAKQRQTVPKSDNYAQNDQTKSNFIFLIT